MELFIVRHAKAIERDPEKWPDDADRPLTRQGAREFEQVARRLRAWKPGVDLVLASGAARAWETAEILRARARWPKPVRTKDLEPDRADGAARILELVAGQPQDACIAIVGHEPALSAAVAALIGPGGTARIELRKGAVAWLRGTPGAMGLAGLLVPAMVAED
jgi:phosphohistidine phosphatase SixA